MNERPDDTNADDVEIGADRDVINDPTIVEDEILDENDILTDVDVERLDPDAIIEAPDGLDVDGTQPLPEQLTGRASGTDEDLVALFGNESDQHMTDGFRGGSEDEPPVDDAGFIDDPRQAGP